MFVLGLVLLFTLLSDLLKKLAPLSQSIRSETKLNFDLTSLVFLDLTHKRYSYLLMFLIGTFCFLFLL